MRKGFSLVELSIVLVILGLITGGILAGQSLIRASELRGATSEYQRFIIAVRSFRDKYMAIPGDMNNATSYWGTAAVGSACKTTSTGDARTCNGNNNGYIEEDAASASNEVFRFWQQLANAGMIEGNYAGIGYDPSGVDPLAYDNARGDYNTPKSKLTNAMWAAAYGYESSWDGQASFFAVKNENFFLLAGQWSTGGALPYTPILQPAEAWNLDIKLDDGKPGRGRVIASIFGSGCTLASSRTDLDAEYNLSGNNVDCILSFPKSF